MVDDCMTAHLYELWRQDDNGNRFLVGTYGERAAAERRLAELTRTPHKQTYWITVRSTASGREGDTGSLA